MNTKIESGTYQGKSLKYIVDNQKQYVTYMIQHNTRGKYNKYLNILKEHDYIKSSNNKLINNSHISRVNDIPYTKIIKDQELLTNVLNSQNPDYDDFKKYYERYVNDINVYQNKFNTYLESKARKTFGKIILKKINNKRIEKLNIDNPDYNLSLKDRTFNKKFNIHKYVYRASINDNVNNTDVLKSLLYNVYDTVCESNKDINNNSSLQIILNDNDLHVPLSSNRRYAADFDDSVNQISKQLSNVLQSEQSYSGSSTSIIFNIYAGNKGSSRKKILNNDDVYLKKCLIRIVNDDNRCLVRAIVIGNAILNEDPKLKSIKDHRVSLQTKLTMDLIQKCELKNDGPYDFNDILIIAKYLDINIRVISAEMLNNVTFKTNFKTNKYIYLYYSNNHYDLITSVKAFFNYSYYCDSCCVGYAHKDSHKCNENIERKEYENQTELICDLIAKKKIKQKKKLTIHFDKWINVVKNMSAIIAINLSVNSKNIFALFKMLT